ncbi:MAG: alpha/beta hydrolase [Bacteroidota bacterium]
MSRQLLHYETFELPEQEEWVVFVHGAGGSVSTWKYQVDDFEKHYNLLLIDLRDHGLSKDVDPMMDAYSFQDISQDIKAVMDQVGVKTAHFVTLSFGSVLVQDFATRYPYRVKKIVFAGGIFKGTWAIRSFVHFAKALNSVLSYEKMYSFFSYLLMPRERNQKARRLYQMQARRLTQKEYLKWVALYDEFFRLLAKFSHRPLVNPGLIIMGGDDYVFLSGAEEFDQLQPRARLQVIPKTGHICNVEQPEQFNQLALDFLGAGNMTQGRSASTKQYESSYSE